MSKGASHGSIAYTENDTLTFILLLLTLLRTVSIDLVYSPPDIFLSFKKLFFWKCECKW